MPTHIGFTGDVMLGRLVDDHRRGDPPEAVWNGLIDRLRDLDALCINLECCLSTRGEQWTETHRPFHFRADPEWAVPALEAAGVQWTNLANNHLLDYGAVALRDTLAALDDAGIAHSGAGEDQAAARTPATIDVDGTTLAFVSVTDNTPEYAAGPDSPGVARIEMDPDDESERETVRDALARAREADPDLLVASLHWGPNMVSEPDERYERFGRWLVGEGVDLVHGHSAHVLQGVELHEGAPILYDCGDFVDDYRVDPDLRNDRSALVVLSVADGEIRDLRFEPVEIEDFAVRPASESAAEWVRDRLRTLSAPYGTEFDRDGAALVLRP